MVLLGKLYRSLDEEALRVLLAVERSSRGREYAPVELVGKISGIPPRRLDALLEALVAKKMLARRVGQFVGYRLSFLGLDMLALDDLVKREALAAVGERIGVGKESDVYEALDSSGSRVILKLYRIGRTSFRRTARVRAYALERELADWLEESKLAAEREFAALSKLSPRTRFVPKPIARSRHALVTEFVEGLELYRVKALEKPREVLEGVLEVVRVAFLDVGIVHGDLSEYNVLVAYPDERPLVIDWPQYIYREHPGARDALERDVRYLSRFFEKRFGVEFDWKSFLSELLGAARGSSGRAEDDLGRSDQEPLYP
ncbi:MAG: RIO1 family regulatory kinase/ATPase [Fervidicoccaceae archaeon]